MTTRMQSPYMRRLKQQIPASDDEVLTILRISSRARWWSTIAAELYGIPRDKVTMRQVRGVRNAVDRLIALGLVEGQQAVHHVTGPFRAVR